MRCSILPRALGLWLLVATLAGLAWWLPPIPQPAAYHQFADQSTCFGIPHCYDTASNLPFVLAGLAGLFFLHGPGRRIFRDRREAFPYGLFFVSMVLIGFTSGYYHLAPDNDRLTWDRYAISLAFMSWFAAILCERVGVRFGLILLPWLTAAGLGSVWYWQWSESAGHGDLRAYGLMQLYPLLLVPLLLRLYPARYSGDRDILVILALYLAALLCDWLDKPIAALAGFVSGHTLKHLFAALAAFWVLRRLQHRRTQPVGGQT